MEKRYTIVHFLAAAALIAFAVVLFCVAGGSISMARLQNPDGSFDYGPIFALLIPFCLCIISFAGLITILQEGEFTAWLSSAGVIIVIGFVGLLFNMAPFAGVVLAGLYAIWWSIAGIRTVIATWGDDGYWASAIMAIGRLLLAAALVSFVFAWITIPTEIGAVNEMTSTAVTSCIVSGALSIAAAVGLVAETLVWIAYCDY